MRKWFYLFAASLISAGCSDLGDPVAPGGEDPGDEPVSFSADLWPILEARCIGCHNSGNAQGSFVMSQDPADLVGVQSAGFAPALLVEAGDRSSSVLYLKLIGDVDYGAQMPLGSFLEASDVELFGRWIDEGAQDN